MIHDVANLLQSFVEKEVEALESAGIKHAPTIGEMYEGLTGDFLSRSIPPGLDLQVVSGFAEDHEGTLSNQIDCMLVRGEGTPIPHTTKFKWHIKDVLAVIEVKKDIFSKGLDEAYHQLRDVLGTYSNWIQNVKSGNSGNIEPSLRAFSEVTGIVAPPHDNLDQIPPEIEHIYHLIVGDQFSPIRIALGYGGFSSEYGLRKGFLKFLEDKILMQGYGPQSFPQLVVAGNASLVKFSGHPYRCPMRNDKTLLLASSRANPLLLILELIWTRLSYIQPMPELFGEDLQTEGLAPLLWMKLKESLDQPGQFGWEFTSEKITKKALESTPAFSDWEPDVLSMEQFVIINQLCQGEDIETTDTDFVSFVTAPGQSVDEFVDDLVKTRLVARKGTTLELITKECVAMILPDERFVAAENNTGRLTRWVQRFMAEQKTTRD